VSDEGERLLSALQAQARQRQQAQAAARDALQRIADLLPAALEAGLSKRTISKATGISRMTLDELLRRSAARDGGTNDLT
jgi:DNA invertase Pin-like site-specific DNA recombinase